MILPWSLYSQDYYLEFQGNANDLNAIAKYHLTDRSKDSLILESQLKDLHIKLQEAGYLNTTFETTWRDERHLVVGVELGQRFQWLRLEPGNLDPVMLQKVGYKEKLYSNQPFNYQEVNQLMKELIRLSGDSGYPFASIKLDSVQVSHSEVTARLSFNQGPFITFDSLALISPIKINPKFLQAYLKVQPGAPFSESLVEEILPRIDKLPYLRLTEEPSLSFQNDQATTYLALQPVEANQIDGVIGFLPNAKGNGGLLLTGQFNLLLQNMFGSGRSLGLKWEGFKPESQMLDINFHQPILFKSPIDLDLRFNLLKEDSTFVNRLFNLDLTYSKGRHLLGIYTPLENCTTPFFRFI